MNLFKKLKKYKILLIDDDEWIRDSMSIFFRSEGCSILTLETAEEAVKLLEKKQFEIFIVDYMLPGMDGIEFFERLSAFTGIKPVRILITAHGDSEVMMRARQAKIDDLIKKPFTTDSLETSLKKFL